MVIIILVCIEYQGRWYNLADVSKPKSGDFLVLESLIHKIYTSRLISVITPDSAKYTFTIGRGKSSDMRIDDVSVSRTHAILSCDAGGYFIEDEGARFSTLVQLQNFKLYPNTYSVIQVGRTLVNFAVKGNKS